MCGRNQTAQNRLSAGGATLMVKVLAGGGEIDRRLLDDAVQS